MGEVSDGIRTDHGRMPMMARYVAPPGLTLVRRERGLLLDAHS